VWTATVAAFMATKPAGGTALHPDAQCDRARAAAEDGEGRLFCLAMESGLKAAPENSRSQPLPGRADCGPIALSKAEARASVR
jgi:hypothetical protein